MALVPVTPPFSAVAIQAVNTYTLTQPVAVYDRRQLIGWVIECESAAWTGSIIVKSKAAGSAGAYKACTVKAEHLNGAVSTGVVSGALTAGSALFYVDALGKDIALDTITLTTGTMAMTAIPVFATPLSA
jgi:hypothetical protein